MDRTGKATAPGFVVVDEHCVTRFVKFDLDDNVLFTARAVVVAQGGIGVPIGGFISESAQAAELLAMWKEFCVFSPEHKSAATQWW